MAQFDSLRARVDRGEVSQDSLRAVMQAMRQRGGQPGASAPTDGAAKEDARGVGGADLIRWCSKHLASYKVPGYIEFRDMLPKSKVGKLLRREVRDEEKRRSAKQENQT